MAGYSYGLAQGVDVKPLHKDKKKASNAKVKGDDLVKAAAAKLK
jgi:hypothetical protein